MSMSSINTLTDSAFREKWMDSFQDILDEKLVAKGICEMASGNVRTFHNPLQSTPTGFDGTAVTTYTTEAITITDDTLVVDRRAGAAEHIDNIEAAASLYNYISERTSRQAFVTARAIDTFILQLPQATAGVADIDDGDIPTATNGGAGNPILPSVANIADVFGALKRKLMQANGQIEKGIFAVVDPTIAELIESFAINNGFNIADSSIRNGYAGSFRGVDIFVSNNLNTTGTLVDMVGGVYGSIFCALPSLGDEFDVKAVSGKHGREVTTSQWYDGTIWTNNQAQIFDIKMDLA